MRVTALPPSFDRSWRKLSGEPLFCDHFDSTLGAIWGGEQCDGRAEIEVRHRRKGRELSILLCRECATDLRDELQECIDSVDGRELFAGGQN